MSGNFERRLTSLEQLLGTQEEQAQRERYRPEAIRVRYARQYGQESENEAAKLLNRTLDDLLALTDEPRSAADSAVIDQMVAWVTAEARRLGYEQAYTLDIHFGSMVDPDLSHPYFAVPFRGPSTFSAERTFNCGEPWPPPPA